MNSNAARRRHDSWASQGRFSFLSSIVAGATASGIDGKVHAAQQILVPRISSQGIEHGLPFHDGQPLLALRAGLPGATLSILDAGNNVVAIATTGVTGFYFMATTGVLTSNATYTLQVTGLPASFSHSTPANQQFDWQGSAIALSNFVLN